MKLEYIYGFSEYNAINSARQRHRKSVRLRNWLFWALVLANGAVSLKYIYSYYQGQVSFSWLMFANLTVAIAIIAYRYIFVPYRNRQYYRQQMLSGKQIRLQVSEQGIETQTDNVTAQYGWKGFVGADEEAAHFVIWVNNILALSIPKRAFKDNGQMEEFRKKIVKNVDNQRLPA